MKILSIGQVPTEVGGNYTTGIARVVYELSKQNISGLTTYLYATNIKNSKAQKLSVYSYQYIGYVINPFGMIWEILRHPIKTIKEWQHYKSKSFNSPIRFHFFKYNYKRAIELVKPDLIHLHGAGVDSLHFANEEYNIPILLTLHGVMWDGDENDYVTKSRYVNNLPFADYYTGLNKEVERKMLNLGVPKNKITLIPNGIDASKFYYYPQARYEQRKKYGVDDNTIVFITVGLLIDRKGQLATLKILDSLGLKYQYWIIGKGPDYETIQQYSNENHLEDKVKLLGYICDTELYKYHSAADIYVHASTMEGQALSEIEAYSTGLRVIVNKVISDTVIGDVYNDHDHYFALDYNNIDKAVLLDWIKQGNVNRKSRQKYDWSIIANQYGDLYKSLLQ